MRMQPQYGQKRAVALVAAVGALVTAVNLACAHPLQPEVLFRFPAGPSSPNGGLVQGRDGSWYGTTGGGGGNYYGTVFRVTTTGVWGALVSFAGTNGMYPRAGLTLGNDGNFYGTTTGGGAYADPFGHGYGTVFRVTTNGVLTTLVSFAGTNGAAPKSLTLASDGNFYGTAESGGSSNSGTVFRVTTNGVLTVLVSFDSYTSGASPSFGLTLGNDGSFYGTTEYGFGFSGTVFKVTTNGVLTTLFWFDGGNGASPFGLTLGTDGNFYGTTAEGGPNFSPGGPFGAGTLFRVTTNGVLTTLVAFDLYSDPYTPYGSSPSSGLTLGDDGNLYGTTWYAYGGGTVFEVTTNGVLTTIGNLDYQISPYGDLTPDSSGNLYGTTSDGGTSGNGSVFRVMTNGVVITLASFTAPEGNAPTRLTQGGDGNFYGTTVAGGGSDYGTAFRITTNGLLTTLISFGGTNGAAPAGLTLGSEGNLYGTTSIGGITNSANPYGYGTVFQVTTNGALITLVSFEGANGEWPGRLTLNTDGSFYGTTENGGLFTNQFGDGYGTVFRVTTNGVLTTLASFARTNGWFPGGLTIADGNFYGTTSIGGITNSANPYGYGTVFQVTTNGALTTLLSFAGTNGASPDRALILGSDGNLYGTTARGGPLDYGTVFRLTANGVLTTLVFFTGTNGAYPSGGLTPGSDGNFYGTMSETVFQVSTNGVLKTLATFDGTDAWEPYDGLTMGNDGNFYGTTGGSLDDGGQVIYRLRHGASIQSFGMKTNGFQLNTLNVGGSGWVVLESSSNLMTWAPIQTNGTIAAQQFLDPAALTQPRQFYRVRQQ